MKELLFLGDSITDCNHLFDVENLGDGYVRMIAKEFERNSADVKIKNMGVDGLTVPALKRLWKLRCTEIHPDFVTILIGINDLAVMKNSGKETDLGITEFKENYKMLIKEIQATTDCPILLMEPFIFPRPAEFITWKPDLHQICDIIRELADLHKVHFLPLWDKLTTTSEEKGYEAITLDGVHLTLEGHRILCKVWLEWYSNM